MPLLCPECEEVLTLDVEDAEEGDVITCDDCGADLEITSLSPVHLQVVDNTGYDDPEETLFHSDDDLDEA